ncbi:MAG: glycoside hydrolase [Bacteroidetes bacterium GWF2_40_14]|nr:MAG: glycoside hydrolase [Bacteroidetes bacterium GWF2_40_14]
MGNLDYGVIGNCQTAALISKYGSIDWLCFPEFDSPSLFAKILDNEKGGSFGFEVADDYSVNQSYFRDTNILNTKFISNEGSFEIFDFMPRYKTGKGDDYYLPAEVYRYVRYLSGNPKFRVIYEPAFNYARESAVHTVTNDYIRTSSNISNKNSVYLYSSINLDSIIKKKIITLKNDQFLLLSYNQKLIPTDIERVYLEYSRTKVYWLNWVNRSKKYDKYNKELTRSLLILKLMSFEPTGAVLAALTTSIPESLGDVRNWDYRFCWLRDASMLIETLIAMGHQGAAKGFIFFIKRILKSKGDTFQIMYGINGERTLTEEELPHLEGFLGNRPVRIGNGAYNQKQNDSLGYLMDVIYQYYIYFPGTLDEIEDMWEIVKNISLTVCAEWHNPDMGIWEFRTREQHLVFSKVMCWVTLDRASKIAHFLDKPEFAKEWTKIAGEIHKNVLERGWKEDMQCFSQSYDNNEYDSSILLMEAYGFLHADDEKYIKSVRSLKANLLHNGLMYRYNNEDDFGNPKSAFTICSFWLIRALYVIGEKKEAQTLFEELLSHSNHVGLFSEDLDFETKEQLGNFPQAYSHLALINTVKLFSSEIKRSKFLRP